VQFLFPSEQPESGDQTRQTKKVITVEVGNKNMLYTRKSNSIFSHFHLGSLATIDQEYLILNFKNLSGGMRTDFGRCGITAQD
jgi:hypothetical protein